jgi:hypothetical protein
LVLAVLVQLMAVWLLLVVILFLTLLPPLVVAMALAVQT